ncbi:MAG: SusC/RagA family protein, partial [Bacteroides sp.]
ADLRSRGWEVSVDWTDRIGQVKYNVGFNLYDSQAKITKYDNEVGLLGRDKNNKLIYRKDMMLGEIWGYTTDRLYTTDDFDAAGKLKEGIAKVEGYNPKPGDILYLDFDNNGIINNGKNTLGDSGDTRVIGNNTRRYQYGIRGGASWKGVAFSFLLQGVGKRDLWVMNELFYPHYDAWTTVYDSQLNYWTPDRTDSYFPRLYEKSEGNTGANQRTQTRFLQDGSYLSIRN